MPTIQEMSHGFDEQGVANYIEELRAVVLEQAAEQIRDISSIEKACNENWEGEAKDRFLEQLYNSSNHTADQFENLYQILVSEIAAIQQSMSDFDQNLFNGI